MMAHDLNNSLGAIVGWAELLDTAVDPDEIEEAITAISRSADYAEALLHQLSQRTGGAPGDQSLSMAVALGRMKPMLLAASRKPPYRVSLEVEADESCHVTIREHTLRRLVLNLVMNARDACGDRIGRCQVKMTRESSTVVLSVSDNGCGMDDATRRNLFQPFFTTKGSRGTGLGLYSLLEIAKNTDGAVDVWSEPGVGTRVTMCWPLAPPSEPVTCAPVSPPAQGVKARILLAEDHPVVREATARVLRRAGYVVHEASDGD